VLPLSTVGVALVDFALQSVVLLLFILVSGYGLRVPELALWPLAFVALVVLSSALALWFSALNVRYRDVGHLLNIALLVWFWATPIVYAGAQVEASVRENDVFGAGAIALYWLNPLVAIVAGFQRALYASVRSEGQAVLFGESLAWQATALLAVLVGSLVVLRLAWGYFFHRSGDFAEEL
jgi:ABC-2 type transport system permease protein